MAGVWGFSGLGWVGFGPGCQGNVMDQEITVCGGDDASDFTSYPAAASYPAAGTDICGHIRTVRAFAILAILAGCVATVLAVLV